MSEIQARIKSLENRPQAMFQAVLNEKLGSYAPKQTANTNTDAATGTNAQNGELNMVTQLNGQSYAGHADMTGRYCLICGMPETASSSLYAGYPVITASGDFSKGAQYMQYVNEASETYGMPVNLILGIMKAESDFNNECVSYAGAKGLMQLMPETAAEVGVTDVFDSRQNILGGVEYVHKLVERYGGDVKLALAAYNTGPGKIARYGVTSSNSAEYLEKVPQSIRDYADRVLRYAGMQY
ncbi:MAG: lytic transglycosylase domain-containing protein [Christensenellaceae bacterium]